MGNIRGAIGRVWEWVRASVGRADLAVLLAALAATTAAWSFLLIADEVSDGGYGHTDERILRSLREPDNPSDPVGPAWVEEAARDTTALGGYTVLTLLVASVVGYLLLAREPHAALLVLAATLGGLGLSLALKEVFARPRPELVPHLTRVSSSSFPSGHAMLSAVVYLTLGALLARLAEGWWAKLYCLAVAATLTFLVGVSRVYLGVHYPMDVAAGWAAGAAWAVACWLAARYFQRHGLVEGDKG